MTAGRRPRASARHREDAREQAKDLIERWRTLTEAYEVLATLETDREVLGRKRVRRRDDERRR